MWIFVVCFGFIDSVLMICCFACCLGFVNGLLLGEICLDVNLVLVPFWFKVCMLFGCLGFVVYLSLFVSCCFVLQDTVSVYCLSWLIRFNDVCFVFWLFAVKNCVVWLLVLFICLVMFCFVYRFVFVVLFVLGVSSLSRLDVCFIVCDGARFCCLWLMFIECSIFICLLFVLVFECLFWLMLAVMGLFWFCYFTFCWFVLCCGFGIAGVVWLWLFGCAFPGWVVW